MRPEILRAVTVYRHAVQYCTMPSYHLQNMIYAKCKMLKEKLNISSLYQEFAYVFGWIKTTSNSISFRKQYAQIFISFKDNQVFASRRSELYGKTDFLANCGGLLGLFMGVSLLSVVEAIYYCTLRLGCNLRKRRLKKRKRRALNGSQNIDGDARY